MMAASGDAVQVRRTTVLAGGCRALTRGKLPPAAPRRQGLPGVGWMAHRVPFQRSASVTWPPLVVTSPAAMHRCADSHDTEFRLAPAGSGVDWTAHRVPFQRSASAPE